MKLKIKSNNQGRKNRRMKICKKVIIGLVFFEIFIVALPFIFDGQAFKNGNSLSGTYNPYSHTNVENQKWYSKYYGTHDWIAEAALDAVLSDSKANNKWVGENGNFWTEKRKICFLIGTEAPDSSSDPTGKKYTSITLNGIKCTGMDVKAVMYFNSKTGPDKMRPRRLSNCVIRAMSWTAKAQTYLYEGKCDAAAFYMGAIIHLIADMACWPHVLHHSEVEGLISEKASNFEIAIEKETQDHMNRDQYEFSYPKGFTVSSIAPDFGMRIVAFYTRWYYPIAPENYYLRPYPSYIKPNDYFNANELYEIYSEYTKTEQLDVSQWESDFKSIIQDHLDMAVKYCAYAINYIADAWAEGDNPKYCEDCQNQEKKPYPEENPDRWRKIALGISILVILGIANSILVPILQILSQTVAASH